MSIRDKGDGVPRGTGMPGPKDQRRSNGADAAPKCSPPTFGLDRAERRRLAREAAVNGGQPTGLNRGERRQLLRDAARGYQERGLPLVLLRSRSKRPVSQQWQKVSAEPTDFDDDSNLGLRLDTLGDIDCDCAEAIVLAPHFLALTARFGRRSAPHSHWVYRLSGVPLDKPYRSFADPRRPKAEAMLVELRCGPAHFTMVHPSVHPSGEEVEPLDCEPVELAYEVAVRQTARLASAALLARHYPGPGARHEPFLGLVGALLKSGWSEADAEYFAMGVAEAAGDPQLADRRLEVRSTFERLAAGQIKLSELSGGAACREGWGVDVWGAVRKWMDVRTPHPPQYSSSPQGMVRHTVYRGERLDIAISNFSARIVGEVRRDNGVESVASAEVECVLEDEPPRKVVVPIDKLNSMNWVAEFSVRATVYAGQTEHVRAAFRLLSDPDQIIRKVVYEHTGWREINGRPVYLHAGGGLGAEGPVAGISVELADKLSRLRLPPPPEGDDRRAAVAASLRLLDGLGPDRVLMPLFCAIWRAPLGSDFSVHLAGRTGSFKTALAALAQQHFGADLDASHLPADWSGTANALEQLAFEANDALLVIDEYAPSGSSYEVQQLKGKALRLFRAKANASGRSRLTRDLKQRAVRPPRALFVSTGEDVPGGGEAESMLARTLVLEIARDEVERGRLTACQADAAAGLYAKAMSGFLCWLARDLDARRTALKARTLELRREATQRGDHPRTPGVAASLRAGLELFLEFAMLTNALDQDAAHALIKRAWECLLALGTAQRQFQRDAEPVARFLRLLRSAITSGRAHVAGMNGEAPVGGDAKLPRSWGWQLREFGSAEAGYQNVWVARGICVGWLDGESDDLFLDPDASFKAAQEMADAGSRLTVTQRTLTKQLYEAGLLVSTELARRQTYAVRPHRGISGLHLKGSTLLPDGPPPPKTRAQRFEEEI